MPHNTDTMSIIARAEMARANKKPMRCFDWNAAATIMKSRNVQNAQAGLQEDWGYTGGPILSDGKPIDRENTYVYLWSIWATPILIIDDEEIPCWTHDKDMEDAYWPESAIKIFNGES